MKKVFAIFIALLLVIGLAACAATPVVEKETPAPLAVEIEPDEPEQPQQPEEPLQAAPTEDIAERPVYVPPETPPETLAEAFAEVVRRFSFDDFDGPCAYRFSLMDIDFDGELELLMHHGSKNGFAVITVFNQNSAMEFIYLQDNEVHEFLSQRSTVGMYPIRFYQNDETGEILFSSYRIGLGGAIIEMVTYTNNITFERHNREILCALAGWGSHFHALVEPGWAPWRDDIEPPFVIFEIGSDVWDSREDGFDPCHIELEGDSPTPTIVQLVNMALEGFTEIPAPEWHRPEDFEEWHFMWGTDTHEVAQLIADWIHSVIG